MLARHKGACFFIRMPDFMYRSISPGIASKKYDMTLMRILYSSAAPLGGRPPRHHLHASPKRGCRRRPLAGCIHLHHVHLEFFFYITLAYGLTETSPTIAILHPDDANMHIGSVGRVVPNLEV